MADEKQADEKQAGETTLRIFRGNAQGGEMVDYTVPVEKLREKLTEVARASPLWDGRVVVLQVSDATKDHTVELRALVSARSAPASWDLRCEVREKLIAYLQEEYPGALPRQRQEFISGNDTDRAPLSPHALVSHHRAG
mgnify:CR=1 FL=1